MNGSGGSAPGPRLAVRVLGPIEVRREDRVLRARELGGPKQRQILEVLLLELGTPVSKDRLVELLWGEHAPAAALQNLESYVSVLRRGLQPGASRHGPLRTANGGYVMDEASVELDVRCFERLVDEARRSSAARAHPLWCRALELASAPLLEDELACEWVERRREVHAAAVLDARVSAAETALELGRCGEAVLRAREVLAGEPLAERAWTALVLGLERSGRTVEGLQVYDRCRRLLDQELGCAPSAVLRAAHERMLRATAESGDDLGRLLSALLVLHGQDTEWGRLPGPAAPVARDEAATVLRAFLGRTCGAAA